MFIKFGDKTKKIFVKKTKDKSGGKDGEENILYLDSGNRRASAILGEGKGEDGDEPKEREKRGPMPPSPTEPRREEGQEP